MISNELVLDMGYSTTVIAARGKGVIFKEPSVVAVCKQKGKLKLLASGSDARRYMRSKEKVPNAVLLRPVKEGVIENAEACILMLKDFMKKALPGRSFLSPRPDVIATICCGTSVVERKNIENVLAAAHIKSPVLMETPIAVSGLLPGEHNLIVVCGASVTDVAIVGPGGIVTGCSVTICGNSVDQKICSYLADNYRLGIPPLRAEDLRVKIGSFFDDQMMSDDVTGRNLVDNMSHQAEITSSEIYPIMRDSALDLADMIESVSMMCPDKLAMDVYRSGVTFCGGFANSYGADEFLQERLKMRVSVPNSPEDAVALGALTFFEDRDKMFKML